MTKRVLVIEDETGIRNVVQYSLIAIAHWQVITAESGAIGLVKAEQERPDAILLDVMMPEMDGIETFRQLQANPKLRSIPTILLTAKAQTSEQQQFINLGVAGVITKPFKAPDLVAQMRRILHWEA
jgi:CheY-like chemotaxis protein